MVDVDKLRRMFPGPEFRKGQKEAVTRVADAFDSGKKIIMFRAPTGAGKSFMNFTFNRMFPSSIYTTPLVLLVDQVKNDPLLNDKCGVVYGRRNYECQWSVDRKDERTCAEGYCQGGQKHKDECRYYQDRSCWYMSAKDRSVNSQTAVMTLSYLLTESMTIDSYKDRDMLVIDECQNIDGFLLMFLGLGVSEGRLPKGMDKNDFPTEEWSWDKLNQWLEAVAAEARSEITSIKAEFDTTEREIMRFIKRLQSLASKVEWFLHDYDHGNEWVFQIEDFNDKKRLLLEPVMIDRFVQDMLWNKYDYHILSSATPPSIEKIGLTDYEDLVEVIDVPSYFPPENNVLVDASSGVGRLSKKYIEKNTPLAIKRVDDILKKEKDVKVLVHVFSYQQQQTLVDALSLNGRIMTHSSKDRQERLQDWMDSKGNKVFVAVEMREGLNLPGDMCRAQVLYKAPFQSLQSKRIKRLLELGYSDMYNMDTVNQIIQAVGRGVRNPEDWCKFYIIDQSAMMLLSRYRRQLPGWFSTILRRKQRWTDENQKSILGEQFRFKGSSC